MTVIATTSRCIECGAALASGAGLGLCPRCALAEALSPADDAAEESDYELIEEIARGGMGVVFRARQRSLGRVVALKMLLGGALAGEAGRRRLRAEAEAAAKLQHPGIVAIHGVGEMDGQPFFTMDFVEGKTLAQRLDDFRFRSGDAARPARLIARIAEAVHYAHTQGVLHRDLKPSNVLIAADDEPRVTDFGIARRMDGDGGLTLTGQALGSPNYMPPEQALGRGADIGPASDVYSLGAILYELLAGRPPFSGDTVAAVIEQVKTLDAIAPRRLNASVPADLENIALRCLEKEPSRRYATAAELADDLHRFVRGEPVRARPLGAPGRAWRWARRRPAVAGLLGAVVVVTAAGFAGVLWQWRRANDHASRESAERGRAERALGQREIQRAEDLLQDNRSADALATLAAVLRKDPANDAVAMRIAAILSQRNFALPAAAPMRHTASVSDVVFSPDGRWLATASADKTARVWDAQSGEPLTGPLPHDGAVNSIRFSADGRRVATASDDKTARVWDAATGEPVTGPLQHESAALSAEFSPDGARLISGAADGWVRVWEIPGGKPAIQFQHRSRVVAALFSPDGKRIVSAGRTDRDVVVCASDPWKYLRRLPIESEIESLRISPDSQRVAVAGYQHFARLWDMETGATIGTMAHAGLVNDVAFSPDGELLATVSRDQRALVWDAHTGRLVMETPRHLSWVHSAQFSGDGLRLLTLDAGKRAAVCDVLTGEAAVEPIGSSSRLAAAALSSDGRRVATASLDGVTQVWDARRGGSVALLLETGDLLTDARFASDGASVLTASHDGNATLWDARRGEREQTFRHGNWVMAAALSPDGQMVLTGSLNNTACLWERSTGRRLATLRHRARVHQVEFTRDGAAFLTASFDGTARTWVTATGEPLAPTPIQHGGRLWHAAFSPDGAFIATAAEDDTARVWDARTGEPRSPPASHGGQGVNWVAFSPDGGSVLSAGADANAQIWDAATGAPRVKIITGGAVLRAQFSPDGRRVVTASRDNTARVWDAGTGQPLTEPMRMETQVNCAEFSPDGRMVATAAMDGVARVWDAATGKPVTDPLVHSARVFAARFSPDGRWLVTAARYGHVWELPLAGPRSPRAAAPAWLPALAEAVAGQRFADSGFEEAVDAGRIIEFRRQFGEVAPDDRAAAWAKWFLADRATRGASPSLPVTATAMRERMARDDSLAGVRERLRLSPGDGLAWARLAQLHAQQEPYENPHREAQAEVFSRRGVALSPREPQAWIVRADVLERCGHLDDEALTAYSKAIALSEKSPNPSRAARAEALAGRRRVYLALGRAAEAQADWLAASGIPPRDAACPARCIDLSAHYNAELHDDWHGRMWKGNNLKPLPIGTQTLAGVKFDVRGIIQISGTNIDVSAPGFPRQVTGIAVRRRARILHFLQATGWGNHVPRGTTIGQYQVHYADGESAAIPVVTGEDLLEWQAGTEPTPALKNAALAWTGKTAQGVQARLFKRTWQNPRPDTEISALDFISARTAASPFLIAITAE